MKRKCNTKKIIIIFSIIIVIITFITLFLLRDEIFKSSSKINEKKNNVLINFNNDNSPLGLKDYEIMEGEEYSFNSFISNYSKNHLLSFETEQMTKYTAPGIYEIKVVDISDDDKIIEDTILKEVAKESTNIEANIDKIDENISDNKKNNSNSDNSQNILNNNDNKKTTTKANLTTTTKPSTTTKINNITETNENITYKYGVTIKKITYLNYDIYSDGNKVLIDSYDEYSYDYSTFNAITNEFRDEATLLSNQNSTLINDVLTYVNQYRSEVGISALTLDNSLNVAASIRALEIGWSRKFDHIRPNGTMCSSVIDELGIGYYAVGENIASGYLDAASVSDGWKNSPGHYANMISSNFGKIGIGVANVNGRYYWVQLFTN